ncbi:MAG: hypothetical protein J7545_13115 [Roseofilum sp. SBFL]|uniref:hypothetical protein n=1 Tax=unclassified Roseofilum TaxID=2620099 RepID=UPI001B228100|nr:MULTISPECIES: hypothetical protein [unclassified Roseofilum]MBP0013215.1 hypothetical protein [Roseofilum sp. SID3]MBP0022941.1 hypothetical protein [Roseofilum sp. SID2]MBP0036209.1 hypothetical protein [Roseofilum sp. SID1]MBP0042893.1 hypothetical protein [Roseofilum sp. SBFL]
MVHPRKSIHRSTGKQRSNRLQFILKPLQNHTLLVWSILAVLAIGIGYEALSILLNPGEIEPEEAIAEVTEEAEPIEEIEEPEVNSTVSWLWLGAIALGSGGLFVLWKSLQNPNAHKRASLNRRQRRGTPLLLEKPQPLRVQVSQRQPITPSSPDQFTPQTAPLEPQNPAEVIPSAELTSPPNQPQKPVTFDVNPTAKPFQHSSLQVPNFPKLTPDIPQGSTPKVVRKTPPQEYPDRNIRKSS